ncbi:MAG: DUF1559 domain-containing protein [Planctomycetaceae bacterium]
MKSYRKSTRGFSLVELVTIFGIVTLGLAVSLPAVQKSREDARAKMCINNLKQIGLSLHNYHDAHLCFAPGWVVRDDKPKTGPAFAWQAQLLPFVDQSPLYNSLEFTKPPSLESNPDLAKNLTVYRCPVDDTADAHPGKGGYGTSNYAGNYGVDVIPTKENAQKKGAFGIFHWNSNIRMRSIIDGTSNVLMVGERGSETESGIWPAVRSNQQADDAVGSCNDALRINTEAGAFSSKHEGGAYFLFCDGSVRFLSETIDSSKDVKPPKGLFQKLAHREDGQLVDLDEASK